jgi:hypothetical protein
LIRAVLTVALMAGPAGAEITGARYAEPTSAYGHGAVAGGEYARLIVEKAQILTATARSRLSRLSAGSGPARASRWWIW